MSSLQHSHFPPLLVGCLLLGLMSCKMIPCPEYPHEALQEVTFDSLERFGTTEAFESWEKRLREINSRYSLGGTLCGKDVGMVDAAITQALNPGVDEASLVKATGDHLVALRGDRLISLRIGPEPDVLEVADSIEAAPPGEYFFDNYETLLIHGDVIVLLGSADGRNAMGIFRLGEDGALTQESAHQLSFKHHEPSRIFASHITGDDLILYMQKTQIDETSVRRGFSVPTMRTAGTEDSDWLELLEVADIIRPIQATMDPALHTVLRCNLAETPLTCRADGFLAPQADSFHVSEDALYVWVSSGWWLSDLPASDERHDSVVYRVPFDPQPDDVSAGITAFRARGWTLDQHSLRARGNRLEVVVYGFGEGSDVYDTMRESGQKGILKLLRTPLSLFSREAPRVDVAQFTTLWTTPIWPFQYRFVGDHVTWWMGDRWSHSRQQSREPNDLFAASVEAPAAVTTLALPHGIDRVDSIGGSGAIVIGSYGYDIGFTSIRLNETPAIIETRTESDAYQQPDSRGFVFEAGVDGGVASLPVFKAVDPKTSDGVMATLFLGVDQSLSFERLGTVASLRDHEENEDYGCGGSCAARHETSRSIFHRDRIFSLIGYELIESAIESGELVEQRRASLLP